MASFKAWLHIGLAIRAAQALRMRQEHNWHVDPYQREIRRRTFWACIALDRLVACCTFRTQTIDLALVRLRLPCSKATFAFGCETPGPWVEELGCEPGAGSESLVMAFLVKTLTLWSPLAQLFVDYGRNFLSREQCSMMRNRYWQAEADMKSWLSGLPAGMQWSESNLRAHKSLGQMWHYMSLHMLMQHSLFLVHHEFLTYEEDQALFPTIITMPTAAATIGTIGETANLASTQACLDGALKTVEMLRIIDDLAQGVPPNIFAGMALLTSASVLLWTYFCSHRLDLPSELRLPLPASTRQDADYILAIMDTWAASWPRARAWATSIRLLNDFYQSRYGSGLQNATAVPPGGRETVAQEPGSEPELVPVSPTPLRGGDGLPDITTIPRETYYEVRLITGLIMEQPELCRTILQKRDRLAAEASEQIAASWEAGLDFLWMNDVDFVAESWT